MGMRDLLGASQCLRGDFRRLIEISQVPQRPAQVAQRSYANVLSILIAESRMLFWVIERPRPLEVLATGDELAHGDIGCAKRAMRQAQSGGCVVALGPSPQNRRRVPLPDYLPTHRMELPNSRTDLKCVR